MTKLDYERAGPPRPGSSSMDHPRGIERPDKHVTDAEKAQRRKELAAERRERAEAIRRAERERLIAEHGLKPLKWFKGL